MQYGRTAVVFHTLIWGGTLGGIWAAIHVGKLPHTRPHLERNCCALSHDQYGRRHEPPSKALRRALRRHVTLCTVQQCFRRHGSSSNRRQLIAGLDTNVLSSYIPITGVKEEGNLAAKEFALAYSTTLATGPLRFALDVVAVPFIGQRLGLARSLPPDEGDESDAPR